MSVDTATALLALGFLFAGYGLLTGVGLIVPGSILSAIGLAYIGGLAITIMAAIIVAVVGIPVRLSTFAVICVGIGVAGGAVALRRHDPSGWLPRPGRPWREWPRMLRERDRGAGLILVAVLVVGAAIGFHWSRLLPLSEWDSWSIWARKGTILFDYGTPPASIFTAPNYAFMHPDYPLLIPMLESIWFRLIGTPDVQSLHTQFWLMLVASLAAAVHLGRSIARPVIVLIVAGFIAVVPAVSGQLMSEYADIPMSLLFMLGLLCMARWLNEPRPEILFGAVLFLAASASTKNEGLTAAVAAMVAGATVALSSPVGRAERLKRLRALVVAMAGFGLAVVPWRLWLSAHHIAGDMPISKGLDPGYVAGRLWRVSPTVTALYAQMTDNNSWYYLLPMAIAMVVVGVAVRRTRRPAIFFTITIVLAFGLIVWGYVINQNALSWYLGTSADRTVDQLLFVAAAALLYLTGALSGDGGGVNELPGKDRVAATGGSRRAPGWAATRLRGVRS